MSRPSRLEEFNLYREGSAPLLLTAKILAFFVGLDIAFRLLGYERVRSWIMRRSGARPRLPEDHAMDSLVTRTYRAVVTATAFYYRKRKDCLPRALAIYHFLRTQGAPVVFRLGVKKYPFSAHAWVEYRGQVIDISPDIATQYVTMKTVRHLGSDESL